MTTDAKGYYTQKHSLRTLMYLCKSGLNLDLCHNSEIKE